MTTFRELQNLVNDAVEQFLADATPVTCEQLGLDPRAHYGEIWVSEDGSELIFKSPSGLLDYYGGFEYVDKSAKKVFGNYVIYDRWSDERIDEHMSNLDGTNVEEEEVE